MNDITYAVSVDVNNPIIPYNVYVASVLDSNVRYLEITLYQNGNVIALSNEATATASLVTDNVLIDDSVECTISDNIITVPLEDLQRHGNLDVQVTVTEGTKALAIPFPIQVRVTPNIAEHAQINENSLGSYAEVVHEITEARGTYTTLHDAITAKLDGKLTVKPIPEGGYNDCTESNTLYYGYAGGYYAYVLPVVVTGSSNQSQYKLRADNGLIECRTRHYSNGAWGSWDNWTPVGREGNIADGAVTWAKLAAALQTAINAKAPASTAYTFDSTTTNVVYNAANPKTIYTNAYVNGKSAFVLTTANNYYQIALCFDGTEYKRELTSGGSTTYTPWVLVNNESTVNKQSSITAANKASPTMYPSIKAVVDYLVANYEDLSNKLSSEAGIDSSSTDTEYPTAKAVFDFGADILDEVAGDLVLKENLSNKKNAIVGNETSEQYYPSIKAVVDYLAALEINAGSVGFDETGTYADGSIGAVVSNQKNAIGAIEDYTNNQLTNNILSEYDDNFPLKNTYIDDQGRTYANDLWSTTGYVKVKPNTYYKLSDAPAAGWFFAAYDANKSRVAGENGYKTKGFTSGSNWEYIRFSLTNTIVNAGGTKLFEGPSLVNYGKAAFENCGIVITVGTGRMYERLRDAVSDAKHLPAAKIVVYPGTYDLTSEFASELASGGKEGILLTGNLHLLFLQGAYVTCEFTDRSHEEFSPFYVAYPTNAYSIKSSNITFEGLNMTAKNCRYCVHDEMYALTLPYIHKYINCNMKFTCDLTSPKYVQCIGGGLGVSGNIVVDGGVYSADTLYGYASVGGDGQNSQQCITYHNSFAATAKSNIRVSNVLLKDRGYFRFSNYGSYTEKTVVCVSGCKTGMPTLQKRENAAEAGDNIELNEWNEEHTVQGHWKLINAHTVQFVPDA